MTAILLRLKKCEKLIRMKRANVLRTLEELWDLEDRYPLTGAGTTGLLRWMSAAGMLNELRSSNRRNLPRKARSSRGRKNSGC